MNEEVKISVDAKINIFEEYFTIPEELEADVSKFFSDTTALGERCTTALEFEDQFVSTGLSARFNELLPKCLPKTKKMTKEEKKSSFKTTMKILSDNKEELIKDKVTQIAENVAEKQKGQMMTENRERMIEEGTYDEYTRGSNAVHDVVDAAGFLKNLFKKK